MEDKSKSTPETAKKQQPIFWLKSNRVDTENGTIDKKTPVKESKEIDDQAKGGSTESVQFPTTYTETLMHIFKGNLGSGLFAMGDAIKNAGILVGPGIVLFLGLLCTHCMHLLLNASEHIAEKTGCATSPGFAKTVELCFENGPPFTKRISKLMRQLVNIFLCITQLGFCCVYFVFISSNIKQIADIYGLEADVHLHMALILLPIILSALVRNLKFLAPLSMVANVFLGLGVIITFYYVSDDLPPIGERKHVATLQQFPLFFGTALFAFEGIGLVLPLKNEMKEPQKFQTSFGVLNVGMTIVTILYTVLGTMSYLKFGENVAGSVTLNIPQTEILGQSVKLIISTAILLSYALQFYIPIQIMWPSVQESCGFGKNHPVSAELLFRTFMVLVTFVLAEAIPYLNLFISLVGAVSSTALALLFPPLLEFTTCKVTPFMIIKNVLILLVGVVGCITGTYESIVSIVNAFNNPDAAST